MKAAIYRGTENIKIKQMEIPEIDDSEALLKVKACSICGTDRKIYKKGREKISGEQILGHEISGEIVEVGSEVEFYKQGMRVSIAPNIGCGYCFVCRQGLEQLCPDFKALGIGLPGGFAEYVKIPAEALRRGNVTVLPDEMSFGKGALIEPLACCYNAYESLNIKPGENLLVFGAGVMGNFHLLLNRNLGTGKIIMVDVEKKRLEFSQKMAADYTLMNDEQLEETIYEITEGRGMDNIITAAPVSAVQKQALDLLAVGGKINFFAGLAGDKKIPVSTNDLHYKQQVLTGTTGSSVNQFRRTLKIAADTNINIGQMITHCISLEDLPDILGDDNIFKNNMKIQVQYN